MNQSSIASQLVARAQEVVETVINTNGKDAPLSDSTPPTLPDALLKTVSEILQETLAVTTALAEASATAPRDHEGQQLRSTGTQLWNHIHVQLPPRGALDRPKNRTQHPSVNRFTSCDKALLCQLACELHMLGHRICLGRRSLARRFPKAASLATVMCARTGRYCAEAAAASITPAEACYTAAPSPLLQSADRYFNRALDLLDQLQRTREATEGVDKPGMSATTKAAAKCDAGCLSDMLSVNSAELHLDYLLRSALFGDTNQIAATLASRSTVKVFREPLLCRSLLSLLVEVSTRVHKLPLDRLAGLRSAMDTAVNEYGTPLLTQLQNRPPSQNTAAEVANLQHVLGMLHNACAVAHLRESHTAESLDSAQMALAASPQCLPALLTRMRASLQQDDTNAAYDALLHVMNAGQLTAATATEAVDHFQRGLAAAGGPSSTEAAEMTSRALLVALQRFPPGTAKGQPLVWRFVTTVFDQLMGSMELRQAARTAVDTVADHLADTESSTLPEDATSRAELEDLASHLFERCWAAGLEWMPQSQELAGHARDATEATEFFRLSLRFAAYTDRLQLCKVLRCHSRCRQSVGDTESALRSSLDAYEHDPRSVATLLLLVQLKLTTGHCKEALEYLKALLVAEPPHDIIDACTAAAESAVAVNALEVVEFAVMEIATRRLATSRLPSTSVVDEADGLLKLLQGLAALVLRVGEVAEATPSSVDVRAASKFLTVTRMARSVRNAAVEPHATGMEQHEQRLWSWWRSTAQSVGSMLLASTNPENEAKLVCRDLLEEAALIPDDLDGSDGGRSALPYERALANSVVMMSCNGDRPEDSSWAIVDQRCTEALLSCQDTDQAQDDDTNDPSSLQLRMAHIHVLQVAAKFNGNLCDDAALADFVAAHCVAVSASSTRWATVMLEELAVTTASGIRTPADHAGAPEDVGANLSPYHSTAAVLFAQLADAHCAELTGCLTDSNSAEASTSAEKIFSILEQLLRSYALWLYHSPSRGAQWVAANHLHQNLLLQDREQQQGASHPRAHIEKLIMSSTDAGVAAGTIVGALWNTALLLRAEAGASLDTLDDAAAPPEHNDARRWFAIALSLADLFPLLSSVRASIEEQRPAVERYCASFADDAAESSTPPDASATCTPVSAS